MSVPELDSAPLRPARLAVLRDLNMEAIATLRARLRWVSDEDVREVMVEEFREREVRQLARELQRGRPRPVHCFSCKRWKARPSSVCQQCGDDPVSARTYMDPTADDRQRFDEAHYGERML